MATQTVTNNSCTIDEQVILPVPSRSNFRDLTGQQFDHLYVVGYLGMQGTPTAARWLCRCVCGELRNLKSGDLRRSRSCGCMKTKPKSDLTGCRFGTLTVIAYVGRNKWSVRCDCGAEAVYERMRFRQQKSCGCRQFGPNEADTTKRYLEPHGSPRRLTYNSFHSARQRCNHPQDQNYPYYGGRGIEFRLRSIEELVDAIGERPGSEYSIDRIDPDGHYEVGNLRWATRQTQSENQRRHLKPR